MLRSPRRRDSGRLDSRDGQKRGRLRERGGRLEPLEDLAGPLQDGRGHVERVQPDEAPALAEEREGLLGDDPEPLPAIGGFGVGVGGGCSSPRASVRAACAATRACSA